MSGNMIPLHPTRGLDPHMMTCPRCGGETNGLTIGCLRKAPVIVNGRTTDQWVYANRGELHKVEREARGRDYDIGTWQEVGEYEKVPDNHPCDKCRAEIATFNEVVAEGGIFFQCKECGQQGVIKKSAPICAAIREKANIPAPGKVGVSFDHCTEHATEE